ncbi:DnaJ-domain-containing protein [Paxillus ammoniavirescens]|nr:DnaJ-domain-containing protein [Paxillus ammoniavirescens]
MATNLYETLGIGRNATAQEIRTAYRRKALETHPDRLPQGASAAEKAISEEMFRKVNNAYEVLSDPQSKQAYDQHGVWPLPTPPPQGPFTNGHGPRHDPFSDPFFTRGPRTDPFGSGGFGFGAHRDPGGFTDPFTLFNSIFGDFRRAFQDDPFLNEALGRSGFGPDPFGGRFFAGGFPTMLSSPSGFNGGGMWNTTSGRMQASGNGGRAVKWVSESWTTSSVNGVTQTKCVRRDSEGNEHVKYKLPDGTERYLVNGIEQPASQPPRALLPSGTNAPRPAPPSHYPHPTTSVPPPQTSDRVIPPPPPYSEAVAQPPLVGPSRPSRHYGHHHSHPGDRHEHGDRDGHGRRSRDKERERERHSAGGKGSGWEFWKS